MKLDNFVNKHYGARVFIIGSGPSFLKLSKEEVRHIEENEISISVSLAISGIRSTYWTASGHPVNAAYALNYADPRTTLLFSQGPGENIFFKDESKLIKIYDRPLRDGEKLTKIITDNTIICSHNIVLNASHLAYILGAREIIFIGFDYNNRLHFYSQCTEMDGDFSHITPKDTIIERLGLLSKKYRGDTTRNFAGCDTISEACDRTINFNEEVGDVHSACQFHPNEIMKDLPLSPFHGTKEKNTLRLKRCVDQFREDGIRLYTLAEKGITIDVGIPRISTKELFRVQ